MKMICKTEALDDGGEKIMQFTKGATYDFKESIDPPGWEVLEADRNRSYAMLTEPQRNVLMGWTGSDDFIKDYKDKVKGTFEEEMADIFIRLLDMCAFKGIDIEFHVKAKMRYNLSREKYHGKKY